jgi:excisionase family DNA binding protein
VAKPLLSVEQAADLLGEARSTLYRAIGSGTFPLPIYRIGSRMKIPRRAVERLVEAGPADKVAGDRPYWDDADGYVGLPLKRVSKCNAARRSSSGMASV